jgi:serine/threonine protein kinase
MSSSDPKSRPPLPRAVPFAALVSQVTGPRSHPPSAIDASEKLDVGKDSTVPPPPPSVDPYLGVTIDGRYRIEAMLGEGGMGVVYLARHKVIDKKVAIKILRADLARDKATTERFLQEAKAASSIGNPHIIDISDFGELPDGSTYFVMEWLDGKPLAKVLEDVRPVPVPRVIHIAKQIADGLAAAHARGIVHRDLKPDNIFLIRHGAEKDFVKILDFGVAKVSSGTSKLTRAGSVVGTPLYMSPEQAAGVQVDLRTDVYALGVILYELASGRVPFDADNIMGILTQHMYKAPIPIRALDPAPQDVPPGLEAVVLKALSKKPEHRYQSMEELRLDLDKVAQGAIPEAVPEMMARSGGFSVPADFFKDRGRSPRAAETPAGLPKSMWRVYAGIAGVLATVGLVALIFAKSSSSTALSNERHAESPSSSGAAPPPRSVDSPTAKAEPSDNATTSAEPKRVLLSSEPLDAHFFQGGRDLGSPPLAVSVPSGQSVSVEARREGFKPETVLLDGSEKSVTVRLVKIPGPRPPASRPAHGPTTSTPRASPTPIGGGEIVNPWAK